jgi:hypothetical protein
VQTEQAEKPYYQLTGRPLTLLETAEAVGVGLSTLHKRREFLGIDPIKGGIGRTKYISAADVVLLQYLERHPYLAAQIAGNGDARTQLRQQVLAEIKARQEDGRTEE